MTSATFLELLSFDTFSDDAASAKRRRTRHPVPLFVEQLEDRTVPDATVGFSDPLNLAAASFSPQPTAQFAPFLTATPVFVAGANYLPLSNQNLPLLTISGVNSVGPSAELYELFGLNAVNSSGQANPLASRSWVPDAFGFGSGTQPGEPWAPAYMNVGLANQQGQQVSPWSRTISYGQGNGARTDGGNQAAPRRGGARPQQPGDANRPDKGNQPDAPKQDKGDGKKDQKEEAPKNADQKGKEQKKENPKKNPGNEQPKNAAPQEQPRGDKPDGTTASDGSEASLGNDAKERMTTIDRILTGGKGEEQDGALLDGISLADPAVLPGSLLLSSAHSGPFSALLSTAASQPIADESFAGGSESEGMVGSE